MQVGIDIEKIERFKMMLAEKSQKKIFTQKEMEYFDKFTYKLDHMAGCFCAKEAVSKALKVGLYGKINPIDIEILHEDNGAPYVNTQNKKLQELLCGRAIDISISHTNDLATAICVIG